MGFLDTLSLVQIEKAISDDLMKTIADVIRIEAKARFGQDITANDIGAYSQVEHIDNPYKSMEAQKNNDNSETGISNHIIESRDRMTDMLTKAFEAGPTPEGRKLLGDATHTLEDLFSHSNFSEIAINGELAKNGGANTVETWGPEVSVNGQNRTLLTTGGFGDTDIGYSLAPALASALFPQKDMHNDGKEVLKESIVAWKELLGGEAAEERPALQHYDKILEIVAEENGVDVKNLIDTKNRLMAAFSPLKLLMPDVYRKVENLVNSGGNFLVNGASEEIPLQQSIQYDPEKVLPSHSQLAKDHTDHHFNPLADKLGEIATTDVMKHMKEAWDLKAKGDMQGAQTALNEAIQKANGYFVHPEDSNNSKISAVVSEWVADLENAAAIDRGGYVSDLHQTLARLPGMDEATAQKLLISVAKGEPDIDIITMVRDNILDNVKNRLYQWFQ